ncbi:MAG TPA: hypothetical protein VFT60_09990 [Bryobacteraceae bacterium]|jgi:hypothetical protein|nr:hypothetical protein [Bryobacteraceae bacterium]
MSDGREERQEKIRRKELEKPEERYDRLDPHEPDGSEPERRDS